MVRMLAVSAVVALVGCGYGAEDELGTSEAELAAHDIIRASGTETFPQVNPCTGNVSSLTRDWEGSIHITQRSSGDYNFSLKMRMTSTLVDGNVTYTGTQNYSQNWNDNKRNTAAHLSNHVVMLGSDGSRFHFRKNAHLVFDADGNVTFGFDNVDYYCG
jgi:hypothetical protein